MTREDITKEMDAKIALLERYVGQTEKDFDKKIAELHDFLKTRLEELQRLEKKMSEKKEYSNYIEYLVSEDFKEKESKLLDKIEHLIRAKLPKPNNKMLFVYAAIIALFLVQIFLFVTK